MGWGINAWSKNCHELDWLKSYLRIVFNIEDDIIKVITFHIARRGRYESTLR